MILGATSQETDGKKAAMQMTGESLQVFYQALIQAFSPVNGGLSSGDLRFISGFAAFWFLTFCCSQPQFPVFEKDARGVISLYSALCYVFRESV